MAQSTSPASIITQTESGWGGTRTVTHEIAKWANPAIVEAFTVAMTPAIMEQVAERVKNHDLDRIKIAISVSVKG